MRSSTVWAYIARRALAALLILLLASLLMYVLVSESGDPLADLLASNSPNREQLIEARIEALDLDEPVLVRYVHWLGGAATCLVPFGGCDLGTSIDGQEVTALLAKAMASTLRLVLFATVLAILMGVAVGIGAALRQYSAFDYATTLLAFLFFSLPIFWVAVLLKQFGAIELNNWLADPVFSAGFIAAASLVVGAGFAVLAGGRRVLIGAAAAAITAAVLLAMNATDWWRNPSLGPLLVALFSAGVSVAATALLAGLDRRRVLTTGLLTVVVGVSASLLARPVLVAPTWAGLLVLGLAVTAIGAAIARFWVRADERRPAVQVAVISSLAVGAFVFLDYLLANLVPYSQVVGGRAVPTIGAQTPNFTGNLWQTTLDSLLHLILPALAIMLVSFATYSRFTRSSMLDALTQDYVRTARAKGLPERSVVLRHAFRNALIPVTTLAALDFGAVIGGAVITESVFGWQGMGELFIEGLRIPDVNQVMGFFVVVAVSVVLFNLLADLSYAWLDPRIRLDQP